MEDLKFVRAAVAEKQALAFEVNDKVWQYAEVAHREFRSAKLLCDALRAEGFEVTENVCGLPTAFKASYGSGHPVLGLLGEYDALSALSQEAGKTEHAPIAGCEAGHGCGHSALGAASLAAALSVKKYLQETGRPGTIIYFGCSAEENCGAKPFMARDGEFDGVDGVFAWHPGDTNEVPNARFVAASMIEYEFHGTTAHAGGSPHLGRSALDACELMSVGCNYLREHMVSDARIHYAYLDCGGTAPNVVQDHARVLYSVRAPKVSQMRELIERVNDVARGAALMTGTTVEWKLKQGYSDCFQNHALAKLMDEALADVGAPRWDDSDYALAREYVARYNPVQRAAFEEEVRRLYPADQVADKLAHPLDSAVHPFDPIRTVQICGSTDVGDVGYVTPTASLNIATQTLGAPGHSWFVTSQTNSPIGRRGLITAAEVMALSCIRAMENPKLLAEAREEMLAVTGGTYDCPMNGVEPPYGV